MLTARSDGSRGRERPDDLFSRLFFAASLCAWLEVATIGSNRNEGERSEPEFAAASPPPLYCHLIRLYLAASLCAWLEVATIGSNRNERERSEREFSAANPPPPSRRRWLFFDGAV